MSIITLKADLGDFLVQTKLFSILMKFAFKKKISEVGSNTVFLQSFSCCFSSFFFFFFLYLKKFHTYFLYFLFFPLAALEFI